MSSQCIYSRDMVEDSLQTSSLDIRQLSLLSGTDTPARYSENEQQMDGFQDCECGKGTFDCLIHPSTPDAWTSFMQASLARTLALLESKQVYLREPDQVFTEKSCVSLAWYDQNSSSWKTYQQSLVTGWEPYSETWPRWGMTQGGSAFVHPMSERRITETDGSLWPTPTTDGYKGEGQIQMLAQMCSSEEEFRQMAHRTSEARKQKYWPTPTAHNAKETNAPSESNRNTPTLAAQAGGQLNPNWVEWLMAFPMGFTVSQGWEKGK